MGKKSFWKAALAAVAVAGSVPVSAGVVDAASTVTVSGKAPKGYSVLLVSKAGSSKAVAGGSFKLKMSKTDAASASLHLVANNGTYAGPVVLKFDKKKKTGNTLLSGKSGNIGTIAMKTGYSVAAAKATTAISTSAKIKVTTAGKPSGAGRLGLPAKTSGAAVRSWGVRGSANGDKPSGEDTDKDGLPNTLDLDDDDDGKIDLVDDSNPSQALTTQSLLFLDISKTINLHAGMSETDMQTAIDAILKSNNNFWIGISMMFKDGKTPDGAHISCAVEVPWCASTSPATLFGSGSTPNSSAAKWADQKSDGFAMSLPLGMGANCDVASTLPGTGGTNPACASKSGGFNRQFIPQLATADVKPGSLFTMNLTKGGAVETSIAGALSPYFVSVPAIKEAVIGGQTKSIDYKLKAIGAPPAPGQPPQQTPGGQLGANGTAGNPFVLGADKKITLTFWRPQRSGVAEAGESKFVDMGGLRYGFYVGVNKVCDASAYSGLSSTLTSSPSSDSSSHTPLVDSAADAVPNAANTLTFTIDITKCEGGGAATIGANSQMVTLIASSPGDGQVKAYQDFYVKVG